MFEWRLLQLFSVRNIKFKLWLTHNYIIIMVIIQGELRRREKRVKQECSTSKEGIGYMSACIQSMLSTHTSKTDQSEQLQAAAELDVAISLDELEV